MLLLAQAGAHACAIARVSVPVKLQWPTARCLQPYDDMYAATPSNDAELNEAANPFDYFISANLPHRPIARLRDIDTAQFIGAI